MEDPKTPPEGEEQTTPKAEATEVVEVKVEEAPAPVTYSQEFVDNLKTEWDTKRLEHDTKHSEEVVAIRKEADEAIARERERQDQDFLRKVEEDGGDVDKAKRVLAREQAVREREQEGETRKRTMDAQGVTLDEALKMISANKLASEHGIDVNELMKAQNPVEMENIALKLRLEKQKVEGKPPVKTDQGVTTGGSTVPDTAKGKMRAGWDELHKS